MELFFWLIMLTMTVISSLLLVVCSRRKEASNKITPIQPIKKSRKPTSTTTPNDKKRRQKEFAKKVKPARETNNEPSKVNPVVHTTTAPVLNKDPENKESDSILNKVIMPKGHQRNQKEKKIANKQLVHQKTEYPTIDDVMSDWDSEEVKPKKRKKKKPVEAEMVDKSPTKSVVQEEETDESLIK